MTDQTYKIGSKMPKGWKSPLRAPLYQVVVEDRLAGGKAHFVGPAMLKDFADLFCGEICKQIKAGFETNWTNPHVVLSVAHPSAKH